MRRLQIVGMILIALATGPGFAQVASTPASVTGAGAATFGSGAALSGVSLSAMRFAMGVDIVGDGTASGDFQSTLLGAQSRQIVVEGKVTSGSASIGGAPTFSGTCSIDLGDGSAPVSGVPFTVTVNGVDGRSALALVIGTTTLPGAAVSAGSITAK